MDGGVEAGDDGLRLAEEGVNGGGAFDAFEVVAVFAGVAGVEDIAIGAEVFDEIGGEFVGDEFGAEGGIFGELGGGVAAIGNWGGVVFEEFQEGIRVGGDGFLDGGGRVAVGGIVEARLVDLDGAGGAGDVLEVGGEGGDELGLADGSAELADGGFVEPGDDGIQFEEEAGGLAAGSEIGGLGLAEGFDTCGSVEAADVVIVRGGVMFDFVF